MGTSADPLLLESLRNVNETVRANTEEGTKLRLAVNDMSHIISGVAGRVTNLETVVTGHARHLKDLEGVGSVVRQVKKWIVWTVALGITIAIIGGVFLATAGKAVLGYIFG